MTSFVRKLVLSLALGDAAMALELAAETISLNSGEEIITSLSAMFQDAVRAIEDRVSRGSIAA